MAKREKTSVSIDPDLWQRIREAAVSQRKDYGDAVEEALTAWLDRGRSNSAGATHEPHSRPPVYRDNRRAHKLLDRILNSGSQETVNAINANLLTFAASAEFLAGNPEIFLELEEEAERPATKKKKA
jgi:hypothetical protein